MFEMSDEGKIHAVIEEMKQLTLTAQVLMFAQQNVEVYRQFITGELPEDKRSLVDNPEYIEKLSLAIKAINEIIGNILAFCHNMGLILDTQFLEKLPESPEEFAAYGQMVEDKIKKVNEVNE
jgi:hypothetical protein